MSELLFSKHHTWIQEDGDSAKIGISDYAQEKLRTILFLNLPGNGEGVLIDTAFGDIESAKTVKDLISPIKGIITDVNEDLIDEPDRINEAPYESWLIKVKVSDKSRELMSESEYMEYIKTL